MTANQFQLMFYATRFMYPGVSITARLPLAISKLETGNWLKNSFTSYHNFFGMTAPSARETTATNKGTGKVATFSDAFDSMRDFFLWCQAFNLKTDADLQNHVDSLRYNTNPKYPGAVANIAHQLDAQHEYLPAALFSLPVAGVATVVTVGGLYAAYQAIFGED